MPPASACWLRRMKSANSDGEDQDRQQDLDDQALGLLAALRVDRDARALLVERVEQLVLQRAVGRIARPADVAGAAADQDAVVVVELRRGADLTGRRHPLHGRVRQLGSAAARLRGAEHDQEDDEQHRRQRANSTASGSSEMRGRRTIGKEGRSQWGTLACKAAAVPDIVEPKRAPSNRLDLRRVGGRVVDRHGRQPSTPELQPPMSTQTEWISESISAMSVAHICSL